jgi:hypothetical protein
MKPVGTRVLLRTLLVAAGVLAAVLPRVHSHGLMVHPPSRNWLTYMNGGFWEPHALSAGGELPSGGPALMVADAP